MQKLRHAPTLAFVAAGSMAIGPRTASAQGLRQVIRESMPQPWAAALDDVVLVLGAALLGWLVYRLAWAALLRWSKATSTALDDAIVEHGRGPLRILLPLLAVGLVLPSLDGEAGTHSVVRQAHALLVILSATWLSLAAIRVAERAVLARFDLGEQDNLRARAVHTQIRGIRNVSNFVVVALGSSFLLMQFDGVRQLGVSLLASAGLAGVVIGFAAQKSLSTMLAGIQIAITQPIRIDDVVVVEGQWGRIEEITLTYVVVRVWDLRRLVLPIHYFLDKPFENWTRTSAQVLGTVLIHTDYRVSVEDIRRELRQILEGDEDWDGEVWSLQVVEANDRVMQLRALMSSSDSSKNWNLRCRVRERLIDHLQSEHPSSLPRLRAETTAA